LGRHSRVRRKTVPTVPSVCTSVTDELR
jgi:hypothetical protein